MISKIGAAVQVPAYAVVDCAGAEDFRVSRRAARNGVQHELPQRAAQPLVGGNIEADFLPL